MRLKELRTERGISQRALGQAIGVTQQAIGRWELGDREPGIEALCKIADYFNISIDELVGRVSSTTPTGNVADILYPFQQLSEQKQKEVISFALFTLAKEKEK